VKNSFGETKLMLCFVSNCIGQLRYKIFMLRIKTDTPKNILGNIFMLAMLGHGSRQTRWGAKCCDLFIKSQLILSNLRGVMDKFNIAGIAGLVMRRRKQKLEIMKQKFKTLVNRPRKVAYKYLYLPHILMCILHRREMLRFYSQFINRGDLCFDVGANLGSKTEIFLKLGATIVAIEPQSFCTQQLKKKYHANSRVILIHKALGEKEGEGELFLSPAQTISSMSKEWINSVKSSGRFQHHTWNKSVTVPMTTVPFVELFSVCPSSGSSWLIIPLKISPDMTSSLIKYSSLSKR